MSFCGVSGLDRSSLTRFVLTALLPIALMIVNASAHAQQVVGTNGENGADCFTNFCMGGNGTDGESVTANGDSVTAIGGSGGSGGMSFGVTFSIGGNGGNGGAASASGTTNATAVGGDGADAGNFFLNGDGGIAGNGGDATATSSAISNGSSNATSAANASSGAGGQGIFEADFFDGAGNGGNGTATSSATAIGSGNATSSATATGGDAFGSFGFAGQAGGATAASSATAKGSGSATASATATAGVDAINPFASGGAIATSYAETAKGGLAQAQAQAGFNIGESQSTAKTTFGGVSVQSTVELFGGGSTEAIAQGGSGQSPVNPSFDGLAFATALPNAAYATTLIGSASNVADALLGPDDKIFGTAILEGPQFVEGIEEGSSSTFDFSFQGDLILGVITGGSFEISANGIGLFENVGDNSVINLGSIFGPNIDLTIEGDGVFAFGGAVPEPSTWAMMLAGFAGLGFLGWRGSRKTAARSSA
jgi:hypothetical protein